MVKSIYRRGAEEGLLFGVYLSVLSILFFASTHFATASIPAIILLSGVPFIIYYFQRRFFRIESGKSDFSAIWMLGMLIFIFGSLLCAIVSYSYLEFVEPTLIRDQAQNALDLYKTMPDVANTEFVTLLQKAIDENLLPSAIEYVVQMIWLTAFSGSMISMVLAFVVKVIPLKNKTKQL